MDFDLLYSLPSVLSTCGWTVPYLASNVGGGDCGDVVIKKKTEGALTVQAYRVRRSTSRYGLLHWDQSRRDMWRGVITPHY